MEYKERFGETMRRLDLFYRRKLETQIMASMNLQSKVLQDFGNRYGAGSCIYPQPNDRIAFWDNLLKEKKDVIDDSIPSAYLSEFDQGLYGVLLGGDIRFMSHPENGWISSMVSPLLSRWDEFERLKLDDKNMWYGRYLEQLRVFARGAKGKFGISHFILVDSLNFVFGLGGATQTYLDVIDKPEMVKKAIRFAFELNRSVQDLFFDEVGLLAGGTCSNAGQWIPGRIVTESLDPFHMTSVDYFEEWGRDPIEQIFSCYDGGIIHIHANGRHLLRNASTLKGLKGILLLDDKGYPSSFSSRHDLKTASGNVPLLMSVDYRDFIRALNEHDLPGGILYQVVNVPDPYEANRCYELVRDYKD